MARVTPICGKGERMKTHIKNCKSITDDERTLALLTSAPKTTVRPVALRENPTALLSSPSTSLHRPTTEGLAHQRSTVTLTPSQRPRNQSTVPISVPALKRSKSLHNGHGGVRTLAKVLSPEQLQSDFSGDLCKLFVSSNTAWAAADNPTLHTFIHKWVGSEVVVQDRRIISGRVLDKEVEKVEDEVRRKVQGKLGTGSCDGWKNVAKSSVVTSVMSVENIVSLLGPYLSMLLTHIQPYLIRTHDVTRDAKTGDHLLKLVREDLLLMETKYGVKIIAWCTDDGPDGKKMRRLLVVLFPWLIAILCWAHQINLIVGDCLAVRRTVTEDINHALDIVKWFNNHGTALELLRQEQVLTFDGLFWALILPVITRWTAHYLALTRLLKLKQPLQICWTRNEDKLIVCAGTKADLQEKAHQVHALVRDEGLWYRIGRYVKIYYID